MSDQRYDGAATVQVETVAVAAVARSPRAGFVPVRANRVRDGAAVVLLVAALLLPWNLEFGVGIPGSDGPLFVGLAVVTLLAVGAALAPHVGPFRLAVADADARRTSRIRLLLSVIYLFVILGFVGFHVLQTARNAGTGAVAPGIGPGMLLGTAGALLVAQPPITSITIEGNRFRRWYAVVRVIGFVSIVFATLAVAFNVYWRLRYLFVADIDFGGHDIAVIVSTLLYGATALIALVIASRWLTETTAAARLAATAVGASGAVASVVVWLLGVGRDIDAFHGIAQNTSTAAVGYEGYLAWVVAAAIVAPTTLYAVFLIKPPTLGAYRGAAQKCLALIAFWAFAAAGLRIVDYLIAASLDLPRALYDSAAMAAFDLVTAFVARWLHRQLGRASLSSVVAAAFSAVLFVFTVADVAIGVALAPRYAAPMPTAVFGNNLVQQITSTFDVVMCVVSLIVLAALLITGPLAGYLTRRQVKVATSQATEQAREAPDLAAPPTIARRPRPTAVPRIVRLKEDSTTVLAAPPTTELAAPTLRIQRRPSAPRPPHQNG